MRYPIYFFLLLSGFFYLTGKPLDDKAGQSADGKVQELAYAKRISNRPVANKDTAKSVDKAIKTQSAPLDVALVKTSDQPQDRKTFADGAPTSAIGTVKQAAKKTASSQRAGSPQVGWRTSVVKPAQVSSPKRLNAGAKKKSLDWTVFGNNRKTASLAPSRRIRSQDEVDAEGIPGEARASRSYRKKVRKARKLRSAKRRNVRRIKKARTTRSLRKRKAKRYARLNRRNKGAYRIARRAKKKSIKKKVVYYKKARRKKFGFRSAGGVMTIGF